MAIFLKRGATAEIRTEKTRQVQDTVEGILTDNEARGDDAVRELSIRFDKWDRDCYRLSDTEIQACVDTLSSQDIKDIEFAQVQVRKFAKIQRDSMKDVEVRRCPASFSAIKICHSTLQAAMCRVANIHCLPRRICLS